MTKLTKDVINLCLTDIPHRIREYLDLKTAPKKRTLAWFILHCFTALKSRSDLLTQKTEYI